MTEFFRHCPGCGRRFQIRLVEKKLIESHMETVPTAPTFGPGGRGVYVQEGRPIVVVIEDFRFLYKCKHCGHEWSETHTDALHEA